MSPPVCAICSAPLRLTAACRAVHEEHCHDCYRLSLAGGTPERHAHPAPETPLVLSPRDVQALVRYRLHREAVLGTGPLAGLVTEDPHG